jgi:hypothetical protein
MLLHVLLHQFRKGLVLARKFLEPLPFGDLTLDLVQDPQG